MVFVIQAPRSNCYRRRIPRKFVKAYKQRTREGYKYPNKIFGKCWLPRYNKDTQVLFGETAESATDVQKERRKLAGFKGHGRYTFGGGFNADAGLNASGSIMGQKYDLKAHGAGNFFGSNMSGHGMYNSALHGDSNQLIDKMGSSVAMQIIDSENTLCISNREFISDVSPPSSSGSFYTALSGAINPGLPSLFPWLSQIALYYEEYEFEQLIFEFKSMVTEGNQNAQGNIIMATQYNALNPLFSSKQQMENYDYANSTKVTDNAYHGVECNPQLNAAAALYVRTGNVPSGQDAKTYDLGLFQLAVSNGYQTSNINLGEVWVSYKIKLRKTKLILPGNDFAPVVWNAVYSATPTSLSNIFQSALTRVLNNNLTGDVTANASNTITFPSFVLGGSYLIMITQTGTTALTWTAPTLTNCKLSTAVTNTISGAATGGGANVSQFIFINVTAQSPTITFAATGTVGTAIALWIFQLSTSI
jgi:Viral coat protein (S domain)